MPTAHPAGQIHPPVPVEAAERRCRVLLSSALRRHDRESELWFSGKEHRWELATDSLQTPTLPLPPLTKHPIQELVCRNASWCGGLCVSKNRKPIRGIADSGVLIATYADAKHIHTHFIINSVCYGTVNIYPPCSRWMPQQHPRTSCSRYLWELSRRLPLLFLVHLRSILQREGRFRGHAAATAGIPCVRRLSCACVICPKHASICSLINGYTSHAFSVGWIS